MRARRETNGAEDVGRRRWRRRESPLACRAAGVGREARVEGVVSATGVLHRQCGDDRVRWLSTPRGGRARRFEDSRHRALAARYAANARCAPDPSFVFSHQLLPWTRSFSPSSASNASSASGIGNGASSRPSSSTIELAADIRKAAATDHIDDTIDYKRVAKRLLVVRGRVAVSAGRDADRGDCEGDRYGVRRVVGEGAVEQARRRSEAREMWVSRSSGEPRITQACR